MPQTRSHPSRPEPSSRSRNDRVGWRRGSDLIPITHHWKVGNRWRKEVSRGGLAFVAIVFLSGCAPAPSASDALPTIAPTQREQPSPTAPRITTPHPFPTPPPTAS